MRTPPTYRNPLIYERRPSQVDQEAHDGFHLE